MKKDLVVKKTEVEELTHQKRGEFFDVERLERHDIYLWDKVTDMIACGNYEDYVVEVMGDNATVHHVPSSEKTEVHRVENIWRPRRMTARSRSRGDKIHMKRSSSRWKRDREELLRSFYGQFNED